MRLSKQLLAKINSTDATQAELDPVQERGEAAAPGKKLAPVVDITYDKSKGDLEQQDEKTVVRILAEGYVEEFGYVTAGTLKEALIRRSNGEKVVSPREADILYRMQIPPSNDWVIGTFLEFGAFLMEGDAYVPNNPWMLRVRYNRGKQWEQYERSKASPENQQAGDQRLSQIAVELETEWNLPLHPIERQRGFHPDLCRPEPANEKHFHEGQSLRK